MSSRKGVTKRDEVKYEGCNVISPRATDGAGDVDIEWGGCCALLTRVRAAGLSR